MYVVIYERYIKERDNIVIISILQPFKDFITRNLMIQNRKMLSRNLTCFPNENDPTYYYKSKLSLIQPLVICLILLLKNSQ